MKASEQLTSGELSAILELAIIFANGDSDMIGVITRAMVDDWIELHHEELLECVHE